MVEEKMLEIPEWVARKLIEVLMLEFEQAREDLKFKEFELGQAYSELMDLRGEENDE